LNCRIKFTSEVSSDEWNDLWAQLNQAVVSVLAIRAAKRTDVVRHLLFKSAQSPSPATQVTRCDFTYVQSPWQNPVHLQADKSRTDKRQTRRTDKYRCRTDTRQIDRTDKYRVRTDKP